MSEVVQKRAEQADWGGVPLLWTPAPEPFIATLIFRVGRADESLRAGGLTHLAEHLALSRFDRMPYDFNGHVDPTCTAFYASGTRDEVIAHIRGVAESLADLPLDRLDAEKRVLAAESAGGAPGLDARMLALRYGAVGYGLLNQYEFGLDWATSDDVAAWARERFTAGNAVVWMTGEPPDGLEPLPLPAGDRLAPPEPATTPTLTLPAYLADGTGGVALSVVAPRSTAIHAAFAIAIERAHSRLRRKAGVSYSPNGSYLPLDGRLAHVVLNADCKDADAPEVQDELLDIVTSLGADGPSSEELEWDRSMLLRSLDNPHAAPAMLDSHARDLLAGVESPSRAQLIADREQLTPDAVARAVAEALDSLLVLAPTGTPQSQRLELTEFDPDDRRQVEGRRHQVTGEWEQWGEKTELIVGDGEFSYVQKAAGESLTWRLAECVAGVRLLSGALTVIGRPGSWVTVYPHRYLAGDEALATIAAGLGEERLVPLGIRARELEPTVRDQLGKRIGRVAPEVDFLPDILTASEELRVLAEARRGHQVGLLTVTDRRLLFQFWGTVEKDFFEKPLGAVSATVKGLMSKRLVVSYDDQTTEFHDIAPKERLDELVAALSER